MLLIACTGALEVAAVAPAYGKQGCGLAVRSAQVANTAAPQEGMVCGCACTCNTAAHVHGAHCMVSLSAMCPSAQAVPLCLMLTSVEELYTTGLPSMHGRLSICNGRHHFQQLDVQQDKTK